MKNKIRESHPHLLAVQPEKSELVVCLHGLWFSSKQMELFVSSFKEAGYHVLALDYRSTPGVEGRLSYLSQIILKEVESYLEIHPKIAKVHWVGYSLGGRIARLILEDQAKAQRLRAIDRIKQGLPVDVETLESNDSLGRLVLVASPLLGSEYADLWWKKLAWISKLVSKLYAPARASVLEDLRSDPHRNIPPIPNQTGAIVGRRTYDPVSFFVFRKKGRHDGKVSVLSATAGDVMEVCFLNKTHMGIIHSTLCASQAVSFISHGRFERE